MSDPTQGSTPSKTPTSGLEEWGSFVILGLVLGPVIAGVVYDQTGSYEATIWMLVVTWLATAGVMLVVKPASHREDPVGVETISASRPS